LSQIWLAERGGALAKWNIWGEPLGVQERRLVIIREDGWPEGHRKVGVAVDQNGNGCRNSRKERMTVCCHRRRAGLEVILVNSGFLVDGDHTHDFPFQILDQFGELFAFLGWFGLRGVVY
jgi:hypothetical protein